MIETPASKIESALNKQSSELESYKNDRICNDLYRRALIGPVFYLIACFLLMGITGYHLRWPWLSALLICTFLILWVMRYKHLPPVAGTDKEKYKQWISQHWLLIQIGSVVWGLVPAVIGYLRVRPDSAIMVATIATVAFSTAASQAFAMHPRQARWSLLALILPAALVFFLPSLELSSTGLTLSFYVLYLIANLRRSANEYAQQIATEVDLIRSRAEIDRLSLTDMLTGLSNRRSYDQAWQQAWHLAVRQKETLALLMLDLDHFKHVNDRYGHLGGDACLQHFSGLLQQHIRRGSDIIARIGGEEFVIILPATNAEDAYVMAEQLRTIVLNTPCQFENIQIEMTVSIGVGTVNWDQDINPSATFSRIDSACYDAKNAGRNKVKLAIS
ncbi:diguanylate cyclase (GGDEF)-like protein [Undibacterium sp. GrIS 1.8]|uniref:GGDEF domain-containing protein n=1 Tax=unclassified Undibacterium TaxID=2630295 RepID=UPI0033998C76